MLRFKFPAAAVAGLALFLVLRYWRGFFPQHAFIVGFAGAALVYWTLRAVENLRNLR